MIVFKGWQKTSLIEYPDKISTVVFTGGCNFRCPYCYNSELVLSPEKNKSISEFEILEFVKNNKHFYQAVIVSGGEPCLKTGLTNFFKKVKEIGLLTGLETNGSRPQVIQKLLDLKLIDYIAMDIKAPLDIYKYGNAIGIIDNEKLQVSIIKKIKRSIELISNSGIKYEFRTTFTSATHSSKDAGTIAGTLKGNYAIQCFIPKETVMNRSLNKVDAIFNGRLKNTYNKIKDKYKFNRISIRNI